MAVGGVAAPTAAVCKRALPNQSNLRARWSRIWLRRSSLGEDSDEAASGTSLMSCTCCFDAAEAHPWVIKFRASQKKVAAVYDRTPAQQI
eukprot:scaffold5151_cov125-Isochrysis_galbana.AAC.4